MYKPLGRLLLRNLEEYWFMHCVTMAPYNVFSCDTSISDALQQLQSFSMDKDVPFGLAMFTTIKNVMWNESLLNDTDYRVTSHRIAKINVIADVLNSKNLLYNKQRERKIWWCKFAQCPSRFVLAEVKKVKNFDVTEIQARFPFGNITVETITHYPITCKLYPQV